MTEAETHVNVLINSSIEDATQEHNETITDEEKLVTQPADERENNFPSYSNNDVTEVETHVNVLINSSIEDATQEHNETITDEEKLVTQPADERENNFPSYSNNDVTEVETHVNVLINSSIEDATQEHNETITDEEKLVTQPADERENNFPSYSNNDVTEVETHLNMLINSSIEDATQEHNETITDEEKLVTQPADERENNFPSYSNNDVTEVETHVNVLINSSIEDATQEHDETITDEARLLTQPPYPRRNHFPSYSSKDVSVRFRRMSYTASHTFNNLMESVSKRQSHKMNSGEIDPSAMNFLSVNYESLDYDPCENHLLQDEERKKGYKYVVRKNFARWFIFLLIGICTALIACFVDISIEELSHLKYSMLEKLVNRCINQNCLWLSYLVWLLLNIGPVFIGAVLVAYVEPVAAGSGIPQVKCYLNGIKMPRVVRIKTLVVKILGVISTVVGGLAGGKEGPMIHAGAVVAAGISQGKSTTFAKDLRIFQYFREDHEKRDFVSGGAAAGVSAAFGAPIGGVLFSIEEGTSFFNQSLTWRTFFASMISTFTLNVVLSAYHGHPGDLSYPGLLNLGKFDTIPYQMYEIPLFMLVGTIGGLFGALWNHINYKMTCFRMRYIRPRWLKVIEAVGVAAMAATMGSVMIYFLNDCKPIEQYPTKYPIQMYCPEGHYSAVAALWFQTPESTVRSLFHDPKGSHNDVTLAVFVVLYFFLAASTFGLSMSSGLFIPSLLIGSAWGRLFGSGITRLIPSCAFFDPGKYALLGAAAQLGGVVRMTISLTAILIEATQGISFGLPVIIVLIMAKWVGDFFNEGIYDIHTQMAGVPLLPWEAPPLSNNIYVSEIMSHPVVMLKTVDNVGHIVELLKCVTFNGFPVVDPPSADQNEIKSYGRLRGLILRSQLIVLIQNKIFYEYNNGMNDESMGGWEANPSIKMFRNEYPRYPTVEQIDITDEEKTYTMDLRPFMNPSPYTLQHSATLPRAFRLFRALGLRHLPVVNDTNEVVGMITRKDVARFRIWKHRGKMGLEELLITNKI